MVQSNHMFISKSPSKYNSEPSSIITSHSQSSQQRSGSWFTDFRPVVHCSTASVGLQSESAAWHSAANQREMELLVLYYSTTPPVFTAWESERRSPNPSNPPNPSKRGGNNSPCRQYLFHIQVMHFAIRASDVGSLISLCISVKEPDAFSFGQQL